MSLAVIRAKVAQLREKRQITEEDIKPVLELAARNKENGRLVTISNGLGRELDFLYRSGIEAERSGAASPLMPPLDPGARQTVNHWFVAHHVPSGENAATMRQHILSMIEKKGADLGEPITRMPRLGSLNPLKLTKAGDLAYVDIVKKNFILKQAGEFYGPFPLAL
jgi:hypothetical protein